MPASKTSGEVRSFLGMANTFPDYATFTAPLRELTKKSTVFKWTHTHIRKHLNDPVLTKVKTSLKEGKWDENDHDLKPFRLCADELTYNVSEDILLKNTRLVIPTALQERATQLGHVSHQDIEKTKSLLREKIWYPNMDKRVKEMVDKCIAGQSAGNSTTRRQCK